MTQFVPGPDTHRALRDAYGTFTTGVTVVTCASPLGPLGITANSFSSVSLDPPLVLWCPAKSSSRYDAFIAAEHFAIHVLAADQQDIGLAFARDGLAFDGLDWQADDHDVPQIGAALARFDCTRHAVHDAGDHVIVVGRVLQVTRAEGAALVFNRGQFGELAPK